jgi:hypothetical protein
MNKCVASQGAHPNSLLFRCFHLKLTFESIKRAWERVKIPQIEMGIMGHFIHPPKSLESKQLGCIKLETTPTAS